MVGTWSFGSAVPHVLGCVRVTVQFLFFLDLWDMIQWLWYIMISKLRLPWWIMVNLWISTYDCDAIEGGCWQSGITQFIFRWHVQDTVDAIIYVLKGTKRVRVAGHYPGSKVTLDKAERCHLQRTTPHLRCMWFRMNHMYHIDSHCITSAYWLTALHILCKQSCKNTTIDTLIWLVFIVSYAVASDRTVSYHIISYHILQMWKPHPA